MSEDQAKAVLDKAIRELREFFPHIQVLVTWESENDGGTFDLFRGTGNFYARLGMAREFLARDNGQTQAKEIAEAINPDEPEAF